MNCVINNSIIDNLKKGKKLEVIRQYIENKYHTSIDLQALKARVKRLNQQLEY